MCSKRGMGCNQTCLRGRKDPKVRLEPRISESFLSVYVIQDQSHFWWLSNLWNSIFSPDEVRAAPWWPRWENSPEAPWAADPVQQAEELLRLLQEQRWAGKPLEGCWSSCWRRQTWEVVCCSSDRQNLKFARSKPASLLFRINQKLSTSWLFAKSA